METIFFWTLLLVLTMLLLLEGVSLTPPGRFRNLLLGGLFLLALLVVLGAGGTFLSQQLPGFSGSFPTFFPGTPS
ncbi:MAG: hypothetical protein ACP5OS_07935 [Leptospirillia bacterium]